MLGKEGRGDYKGEGCLIKVYMRASGSKSGPDARQVTE